MRKSKVILYKTLASKVIENLKIRSIVNRMDAKLDTMGEEADPKSLNHKHYVCLKLEIARLEKKRRLIGVELHRYGITIL